MTFFPSKVYVVAALLAVVLHGGIFAFYSEFLGSKSSSQKEVKAPVLQVALQRDSESRLPSRASSLLEQDSALSFSNEQAKTTSQALSPSSLSPSAETLSQTFKKLPTPTPQEWALQELATFTPKETLDPHSLLGSLPDFSLKKPTSSSKGSSKGPTSASSQSSQSSGSSKNTGNSSSRSETGQGAGGAGGAGLIEGATPPRYKHNPLPVYPHQARQRGKEGVVVLQIIVSAEGLPESVSLLTSSGDADLDSAALSHVQRTWRFHAGTYENIPVRTSVEVPIHFTLN